MTNEEVGKYIRLLCLQHQKGHLREKDLLSICQQKSEEIFSKFIQDENGNYYNQRLEIEINKRNAYSESRRNNRNKVDNSNTNVYLIKDTITGLVKIGSSNNPERRLVELKNQYNNDFLVLLAYVENVEQKLETKLHNKYKKQNKTNEWFELSDLQIEEIVKSNHMIQHMNNHMIYHMGNENINKNINEIVNRDNRGMGEEEKEETTSWDGIEPKKSKSFCKPTVDEITSYCLERNNRVDAQHFYDFYESKGWMVGKNKMKDWKACVRTWERNDNVCGTNSRATAQDYFDYAAELRRQGL